MYFVPLSRFLKQQGIIPLLHADSDYLPGTLLRESRKGFIKAGDARTDLFGENREKWKSISREAHILNVNVKQTVDLSGGLGWNGMGMVLSGGLKNARHTEILITGVKIREFDSKGGSYSPLSLDRRLAVLKGKNPGRFSEIRKLYLLTSAFYASSCIIRFDADARTEAGSRGAIRVNGNARLHWTSDCELTVSDNDSVPFGFQGWRIGKGM